MNAQDFPNGFTIKDEQVEELTADFDVVFIERINKGYDKALNNTMFHWELDKLYDLDGDKLYWFAKENSTPLAMNRANMHAFIKTVKGSVLMIEKEGYFISVNHPDYVIDYGDDLEDAEEAELI